jgi:hypothetical protein
MINPEDAKKVLTVLQLSQMAASLTTLIVDAITNGQDGVTEEELAATFADKDLSFVELAASIAKAKAEGR